MIFIFLELIPIAIQLTRGEVLQTTIKGHDNQLPRTRISVLILIYGISFVATLLLLNHLAFVNFDRSNPSSRPSVRLHFLLILPQLKVSH